MKAIQALPEVLVELDGVPLAAEDARALEEVLVRQCLSLPTLCQLRFLEPSGPLGLATSLPVGSALRVSVRGQPAALFAGEVTAAEYVYGPARGRELRIRGYDLLHRLRKQQPVRAHVQVNLLELARELVADLGYSVEAVNTGPLRQKMFQHRQSNLDLLTEAAQRCGLYFTARDVTLHLLTLQGTGAPVTLELGVSLLEARIETNGDPACRSVSVSGWDPLRIEEHKGQATNPRVGRDVEVEVLPHRVGGSGAVTLSDQIVQDDRQAEALAQAELDVRVAREVTLWGVAEGDPQLRPGTVIDVRGLAGPLNGRYVLTAVTHTCDSRKGYISKIETTPPAAAHRSTGTVAAYGVVTRVDDPEGLGRIQATLPTYGNLETEWMTVVAPGAGPSKGLMALPDVGDQVLVLFTEGDPTQGMVVGGLYGSKGPPDAGVEGGAVRRYTLLTPGGQRLRLDDGNRTVRLENSDGSYLELTPDRVRLHSQRTLEIEAPGQQIVIRGKAIDFQRA